MPKKLEITIEVEEVAEKTMYLTQHFGDGTLGKTKFDARFTLPAMGLLIEIDKKRYKVSSQEVITKVVELHESKQK